LLIKKIMLVYQKITLDCILKELSYLDFAFINNVGFAIYNNSLDKKIWTKYYPIIESVLIY